MSKLSKNYYYASNGDRKVNCYLLNIPKAIVEATDIKDSELNIYAKDNKIIIEKKDYNG